MTTKSTENREALADFQKYSTSWSNVIMYSYMSSTGEDMSHGSVHITADYANAPVAASVQQESTNLSPVSEVKSVMNDNPWATTHMLSYAKMRSSMLESGE